MLFVYISIKGFKIEMLQYGKILIRFADISKWMLSKSIELSLLFKNYRAKVGAQMEPDKKAQLVMMYEKIK